MGWIRQDKPLFTTGIKIHNDSYIDHLPSSVKIFENSNIFKFLELGKKNFLKRKLWSMTNSEMSADLCSMTV